MLKGTKGDSGRLVNSVLLVEYEYKRGTSSLPASAAYITALLPA